MDKEERWEFEDVIEFLKRVTQGALIEKVTLRKN